MPVSLKCPTCGHDFRLPDDNQEPEVLCPSCRSLFPRKSQSAPSLLRRVPPAASAPPPATAPNKTVLAEPEAMIRYTCPRCKKSLESPVSFEGNVHSNQESYPDWYARHHTAPNTTEAPKSLWELYNPSPPAPSDDVWPGLSKREPGAPVTDLSRATLNAGLTLQAHPEVIMSSPEEERNAPPAWLRNGVKHVANVEKGFLETVSEPFKMVYDVGQAGAAGIYNSVSDQPWVPDWKSQVAKGADDAVQNAGAKGMTENEAAQQYLGSVQKEYWKSTGKFLIGGFVPGVTEAGHKTYQTGDPSHIERELGNVGGVVVLGKGMDRALSGGGSGRGGTAVETPGRAGVKPTSGGARYVPEPTGSGLRSGPGSGDSVSNVPGRGGAAPRGDLNPNPISPGSNTTGVPQDLASPGTPQGTGNNTAPRPGEPDFIGPVKQQTQLSQPGGLKSTEGTRLTKPSGQQTNPTHPLTKHGPDASDTYLKDRVQSELIDKGKTQGRRTRFDDRAVMEEALAKVKLAKQAEINAWLRTNPPAGAVKPFSADPNMGNLGTGFEVGPGGTIRQVQQSLTEVNLVLMSDGNGGYVIHTAHPQ